MPFHGCQNIFLNLIDLLPLFILYGNKNSPHGLGETFFLTLSHSWHWMMWPSNSLQKSGNAWTLLRGPCTGTWWWRPTGTCCLWVRIASLWSWNLVWGYLCIFPLCLLGAPVLLDWVHSPVDSDFKNFVIGIRSLSLSFLQVICPLYDTQFSTAWVFIKLISIFGITNSPFSPPVFLAQWFWERS